MAKLSRGGVAYDLSLSPFKVELNYGEEKITFKFSSELNVGRFENKIKEHRENITKSLSNRFNIGIDIPVISDIVLYSKVEKRGFLVVINGEECKCQNIIKLTGVKKIQKN